MTNTKGYDREDEAAQLVAKEMILDASQRVKVKQVAATCGLTMKEASFAYLYALSGDLLGSYHASDYTSHSNKAPAITRAQATLVISRPHIANAIFEIQKEQTVYTDVNRTFITRELMMCLHTAKVKNSIAQVRGILGDLAKLHGLIIDKAEIDTSHKFQVMETVTIDGQALQFNVGTGKRVVNEAVQRSIDTNNALPPPTIDATPDNDISDLI